MSCKGRHGHAPGNGRKRLTGPARTSMSRPGRPLSRQCSRRRACRGSGAWGLSFVAPCWFYRVFRNECLDRITRNHEALANGDIANSTLMQEIADLILGEPHDCGSLFRRYQQRETVDCRNHGWCLADELCRTLMIARASSRRRSVGHAESTSGSFNNRHSGAAGRRGTSITAFLRAAGAAAIGCSAMRSAARRNPLA